MVENVKQQVLAIIAEQAFMDVSEISISSTLEDVGIDSLGLVEAVFAIEEAFDVQVPFNANDPSGGDFDVSNVGNLIGAVESLVASKV